MTPDRSPVIDVTGLFLDDLPEFSAKRRLDASGADRKRSFIGRIRSFPANIEAEVTMTYKLSSGPSRAGGRSPAPRPGRRRTRRNPGQAAVTVLLHHSMVKLPDVPMQPRRHDDRVGFFSVSFEDYSGLDDRH